MKILFCVTKSELGGVSTHISQLTKELIHRGHTVAVMSSGNGWLRGKIEELGAEWVENNYFQNSYSPVRFLKSVRYIRSFLKEFKPDIVSLHSSIAGLDGRFAIWRSVPTLFTAHGWAFTEGVPSMQKNIALCVENILAPLAYKIICVSKNDLHLAQKKLLSHQHVTLVHNGVEILEAATHPEHTNTIVCVARFVRQKRQDVLVKVANKHDLSVRFIGDGPLRTSLEKVSRPSVCFVGALRREEIFEELRSAGVFVLMADWEGFPRSILEAMSVGLPVIASDVGGVSEIVDDSVGVLLKENTEAELENALLNLLNDSEKRKQMGENARKRIEHHFSIEQMLGNTFTVYEDISGKRV